VFLLCTVVQVGGTPFAQALRFQRMDVLGGEVWRLLSGNLVHLGWVHWALNMAALAVCLWLDTATVGRAGAVRWAWRFVVLCAGVGLMLLWLSPSIASYVGLSGVVYGLFVLALWPRARSGEWIGWVGLLIVVARMAMQLSTGTSADEETRIGGPIVAQAHLYGVITAMAISAGEALAARQRRRAVVR
jgi:rhomboid family GlyGly-CTERM serine protease